MSRMEEIERQIKALNEQMRPLIIERDKLENNRRHEQSRNFIKATKARIEDVELSSGEGKPWFGTIFEFSKYIKSKSIKKRFCEWNDRVYFTSDILAGRMDNDCSCYLEDFEKEAKPEGGDAS